jgi:hypothetical protein
VKLVLDAIIKAQEDMAKTMSDELRAAAIKDGWEPKVAKEISIKYHQGAFKYDLGDKHADSAFMHEFGSETAPPKATIRKYMNNVKGPASAAIRTINSSLKGSK